VVLRVKGLLLPLPYTEWWHGEGVRRWHGEGGRPHRWQWRQVWTQGQGQGEWEGEGSRRKGNGPKGRAAIMRCARRAGAGQGRKSKRTRTRCSQQPATCSPPAPASSQHRKPKKRELVVINGLTFCRAWRTDFPVLYECPVGQEYVLPARLLTPHRPYMILSPRLVRRRSGPRGLSVPGPESLVSAARLVRRLSATTSSRTSRERRGLSWAEAAPRPADC
jgi:hypothetical protein